VSTANLLERLAAAPEKFPGALLLTGSSEARLEAEARRLAAILLCPGEDPERRCASCRRTDSGLHPDLLSVEPQGVQIRIDSIREAIAFGSGKPYEAARRVAVIGHADRLGVEAANALLKSLEEPGRHLHWILATTRPENLPATVRSRCSAVELAPEPRAKRAAAWTSRGFSEADAEELALLELAPEEDARGLLENYQRMRADVLIALRAGLVERRIASLLLLADSLGQAEPVGARLLAELLADAAIAASGSADRLRHRPVAAAVLELAARLKPEALRRAALKGADAPADNRRGNRRLHYESLLLELLSSGVSN
jgi:DNA polymerase-3 subunit delta'